MRVDPQNGHPSARPGLSQDARGESAHRALGGTCRRRHEAAARFEVSRRSKGQLDCEFLGHFVPGGAELAFTLVQRIARNLEGNLCTTGEKGEKTERKNKKRSVRDAAGSNSFLGCIAMRLIMQKEGGAYAAFSNEQKSCLVSTNLTTYACSL